MAVKLEINEICEYCGEVAARATPQGVWWGGHRCPKIAPPPGPQSPPRCSPWHGVNFVRADGLVYDGWDDDLGTSQSDPFAERKSIKYRKKPVVIEAMQVPHPHKSEGFDLLDWLNAGGCEFTAHPDATVHIKTLEGTMTALTGDWIIKGVKGEFYPCKPDIFAATYEAVVESEVEGLNAMTDHELAS